MSGEFCCHICAEFFDNESDLQKHLTTVHGQLSQKVQCPKCNRAFSRKDNLKAHIESVHREGASKFICQLCQKSFLNASTTRSRALLQDQPAAEKPSLWQNLFSIWRLDCCRNHIGMHKKFVNWSRHLAFEVLFGSFWIFLTGVAYCMVILSTFVGYRYSIP